MLKEKLREVEENALKAASKAEVGLVVLPHLLVQAQAGLKAICLIVSI